MSEQTLEDMGGGDTAEALANLAAVRWASAGCGGRGTQERRGGPRGEVPCRVCQGRGVLQRTLDPELLAPAPHKVYWQGRRWWRHSWSWR
jgi:DnaJ-class molecular chaperone